MSLSLPLPLALVRLLPSHLDVCDVPEELAAVAKDVAVAVGYPAADDRRQVAAGARQHLARVLVYNVAVLVYWLADEEGADRGWKLRSVRRLHLYPWRDLWDATDRRDGGDICRAFCALGEMLLLPLLPRPMVSSVLTTLMCPPIASDVVRLRRTACRGYGPRCHRGKLPAGYLALSGPSSRVGLRAG